MSIFRERCYQCGISENRSSLKRISNGWVCKDCYEQQEESEGVGSVLTNLDKEESKTCLPSRHNYDLIAPAKRCLSIDSMGS